MKNLKRMAVLMLAAALTVTQSNIVTLAASEIFVETVSENAVENELKESEELDEIIEDTSDEIIVENDKTDIVNEDDIKAVEINEESFPDAGFRNIIAEQVDLNENGILDVDEIEKTTFLGFGQIKVENLDGIENLKAINRLYMHNCNGLKKLDLSKNPKMVNINIYQSELGNADIKLPLNCAYVELKHCGIKSIDLSDYTQLIELNLCENALDSIDVSKNTKLYKLDLSGNPFEAVDLSNNEELEQLTLGDYYSANGKLTAKSNLNKLDLSKNKKLTFLVIEGTNVKDLNLSENTELSFFSLKDVDIENIDFSKNMNLNGIQLLECPLIKKIDFSKNSKLDDIEIEKCENLSDIVFPDNNNITRMEIIDCNINAIDLRSFKLLNSIDVSKNPIKKLDISVVPELDTAIACECGLEQLIVGNSINLKNLYCAINNLEEIDVSGAINLSFLECTNNNLKKLDISNNKSLYELFCEENYISELDITESMIASESYCVCLMGNQKDDIKQTVTLYKHQKAILEGAGIISGRNIETIILEEELLPIDESTFIDPVFREYVESELDLDRDGYLSDFEIKATRSIACNVKEIQSYKGIEVFKNLKILYAGGKMKELDFSGNTSLTVLSLANTEIESLNISKNDELKEFSIYNNEALTSLDFSNNKNLKQVTISGVDNLEALDFSGNTLLLFVAIESNDNLKAIDFSQNKKLDTVYIRNNKQLTSLDLRNNNNLLYAKVYDNSLENIKFANEGADLLELLVYDNNLTELNTSKMNKLTKLYCYNNKLTSLDMVNNDQLLNTNEWNLGNQQDDIKIKVYVSTDAYNNIKDTDIYNKHIKENVEFVVHEHEIDKSVWIADGDVHYHKCRGCNEQFDAEKHAASKVEGKKPTCTELGISTYYECVCGCFEDEACTKIIVNLDDWKKNNTVSANGHSWDSGKVTRPASFHKEGTKEFACANCLEKKTESIPGLDHLEAPVKGKVDVKAAAIIALTVSGNDGVKATPTKMKFKVDNKKLASVSSKGVLKAKKTGNVKVTVYVRNESKKYVEACTVDVYIRNTAVEKKVNLNSLNDTVELNNLVKDIPEGYAVRFELTGSNAKKAELKDNVLKPLKKGTIKVKCTLYNESKYVFKKSIKIVVKLPKK